MLRVAIVDDEPLARQGLRELLAAHPALEIVGEADDRKSALALLQREKPDAVFLDIQLPGADGFEILSAIDPAPKVIFVTAHARHAVRAFEVQALDYLLKPVRPERFADAVRRLELAHGVGDDVAEPAGYGAADRICLRTPQRTVVAAVSTLCALEADGDFTRVFVPDAPSVLICQTLSSFEKTLPSPPFIRLDRSLMVNLDQIARLERKSRDDATLVMKGISTAFPLGRTSQSRLREHLP